MKLRPSSTPDPIAAFLRERFPAIEIESADRPACPPHYALAIPLLLIPSMTLTFILAARGWGAARGYLFGFLFYWLFWCLLMPRLFLGREGFAGLLSDRTPLFRRANLVPALVWLLITGITILMYGADFMRASWMLILAAVPLAAVNGICEELLWRGLFVKLFPHNAWLGILYPSAGFALWHFAPQTVFPADGRAAFVLSTFFLGIAYGFIAHRTGSARWTAISHSLNGLVALAAPLAALILELGAVSS